ncbi:MAG: oligosaccharide flippase family protein [Nanoarchaeota archaeon]
MDDYKNNKILQEIVKGAGLLFTGTLIVYIIKFLYRIIVSRYLGPSGYGLLSLADSVINLAFLFALMGIPPGIVKYVAHYLGENQLEKAKGMILASFKITIPLSIMITTAIIIFSEYIAIGIFHQEELSMVLVIFALALPFYAITNNLNGIFFAFKKIVYPYFTN